MRKLLMENRLAINRALPDAARRRYISPALLAQYQSLLPVLGEWARGDVLDVGAGDMPFRSLLPDRVASYQALDRERRAEGIDYVADVMEMDRVLPAARFDTVLLLDVLEHLPDPAAALAQIHRVLRPGGALILSVPHLSRLHERPHDYFRFTEHGLRHLLEQTSFDVRSLCPVAGLASFLGHQASTLALCTTWHLGWLRPLSFALNKWLVALPAVLLDRTIDPQGLFAMGYVAVALRS